MNLSFWDGLFIGLVQGLTEFLPISSSGHLVLAERLVGYRPRGVFVEVTVHVGTLLSVVVAYRVRIAELLRDMAKGGAEGWRYAGLLLLASVPAGLAGILGRDFFERTFHSLPALGWNFLITAALLWSTRWTPGRAAGPPSRRAAEITIPRALLIGSAQAVAILPGISRSGATIAAALWAGVPAPKAAEFSFLMSVVVIAGSGLLEARHLVSGDQMITPGLAAAFVMALVSGIGAIELLVWLLRRGRFHYFAPYCAGLGVLCLIWFAW